MTKRVLRMEAGSTRRLAAGGNALMSNVFDRPPPKDDGYYLHIAINDKAQQRQERAFAKSKTTGQGFVRACLQAQDGVVVEPLDVRCANWEHCGYKAVQGAHATPNHEDFARRNAAFVCMSVHAQKCVYKPKASSSAFEREDGKAE